MLHEGSAIADAIIKTRGYTSLPQPEDLIDRGFSKAQAKTAPALGIPLWNVHGERHGWQIRPDAPRQRAGGSVNKYETPRGDRNILDVHPSVQPLVGDPNTPLWITEGVRKGDALASRDQCTIALMGGVWGFRGSNEHGGKVILPDWEYVALNGRLVYVVYDSDIYQKPQVESALKALYRFLRDRYARPGLVRWPEAYRQAKIGVDDFLAQGHSLDELLAMVPPMGHLPTAPPAQHNGHGSKSPQPTIKISPDVAGIVDEATQAIHALRQEKPLPESPVLYQRARSLVIITRNGTPPKWLRRQGDTPTIQEASVGHLWELTNMAARWFKRDERKDDWKPATAPRWVVDVLQGRSAWPFPMLEGVVCSPTLRPDGSLLATPGYDASTGLYLDFNGTTFPDIPERPDLDAARSALGRLHEVFRDFLFAVPEKAVDKAKNPSLSATYAAVLTLIGRSAIQGNIPLFGVTATAAGSGKGKLVDAIALIATGRFVPKMGQTLDDNEELKRLLALALEGANICCLDNVTEPLGNQYLDMALTAQSITGRILGQTVTAEAPWNAVMFATGNNLTYRGDMVRRVVPISLDPKMEKPEERTNFQHPNLEEWVRQQRPGLVVNALTILQAFFRAGCPSQGLTPYGSFEAWSDLVRNALVWLGEADPCEGRNDLAAKTDEAYERLATLLTAWEACFPAKSDGSLQERTINQAKQEIACFSTKKDAAKDAAPNTWDHLQDALAAFDYKYDGRSLNTNRLGNAFRAVEGRVIDDKRLKRCGEYRHNALWRVEKV
jgi:hypothetical protein